MNIKPKAQIGEVVNIVGCDYIQTNYGFSVVHLQSHFKGNKINYYVHDIEATISLKTGEIKYKYLIGRDENYDSKWFHGGWISEGYIEKLQTETMAI
jgi:hypothetical protein